MKDTRKVKNKSKMLQTKGGGMVQLRYKTDLGWAW